MEGLSYIIIVLFITLGIIKIMKRWDQRKEKKILKEIINERKYQKTLRHSHQNNFQQTPPEPTEQKQEEAEEKFDYSYMPYKKRLLLTKTEYAFYVVLMKECNKRKLLVCPKVRLEDLVYVTDKEHPFKYRGYVKSRHVDFIITDLHLNALTGIELDDPSHENYKAAKIDRFKNELFKTIKVPLIRIKTGTDYATQLTVIFDNLNFNANTTMAKTAP